MKLKEKLIFALRKYASRYHAFPAPHLLSPPRRLLFADSARSAMKSLGSWTALHIEKPQSSQRTQRKITNL